MLDLDFGKLQNLLETSFKFWHCQSVGEGSSGTIQQFKKYFSWNLLTSLDQEI